jgi:hypothetical protein
MRLPIKAHILKLEVNINRNLLSLLGYAIRVVRLTRG